MLYTEKDDVIMLLLLHTFRERATASELLMSSCTQKLCVVGQRELSEGETLYTKGEGVEARFTATGWGGGGGHYIAHCFSFRTFRVETTASKLLTSNCMGRL